MLTGRHAVVTGGATGIGRAISEALATKGAFISILARDVERAKKVAKKLPKAVAIGMDLTKPAVVDSAFQNVISQNGDIDILVNNAGAAQSAPFEKTNLDLWQAMLDVNLTGTYLCTRAALKSLKKSKAGHIINIASTSGLKGYAYTSAYTAAKHGVIGLTRALAVELAESPVRVNAVCPGFTDTKLVQEFIDQIVEKTGRSRDDVLSEFTKFNPQNRLVDPKEVAETVLWLCSNNVTSLTGQALTLAGGEIM